MRLDHSFTIKHKKLNVIALTLDEMSLESLKNRPPDSKFYNNN